MLNLAFLNRRHLLVSILACVAFVLGAKNAAAEIPPTPFVPVPIPAWAPYKEGVAEINNTKIYYRDSGGEGMPVFLLHPVTGSALVWSYQQPALVKAGFRVIAYSRRGHYGSASLNPEDAGIPSRDLDALADHLNIKRFAMLGTAAGTAVAIDYAIERSDRLTAMIVAAGSYLETEEPEYKKINQHSRIAGFNNLPPSFRELSPSYRAANIEGTKAWEDVEHKSITGTVRGFKSAHRLNWANLAKIKAPTLFIAGGADLAAPPTMMRVFAQHVPNADMVVIPDVGHSAYWELPDVFNAHVVNFLRKHSPK